MTGTLVPRASQPKRSGQIPACARAWPLPADRKDSGLARAGGRGAGRPAGRTGRDQTESTSFCLSASQIHGKKGGPRAAAASQKRVCLNRLGNRLACALARAGQAGFCGAGGPLWAGPVSSLERMAISVYARALSGGGRCSSRFCALLQLKLVLHDYGSGTFRSTA